MPLRNAFVPIPDIIQIPEKSSSDSCTKYATHIAPLLVRNAASPRSCARHTNKPSPAQNGLQVGFRGGNGLEAVPFLQGAHHPRREERGQGRPQPDVPDA